MNWRVDQAWGAAMIGGAIHDASGGYYGTTLTGAAPLGHPTDKLGWVATAGLRLNAPNGSYLPGAGQLHRRCSALHQPHPVRRGEGEHRGQVRHRQLARRTAT